ncbi:transglutaminase family protein [Pelagibacterium xiamenense]|uniref:transglutaminase family protein n=1 Tax=Pelagibacterium xiamenense TaxID=2901140 RepID=UPI001E6027A8|nr:transglutaminase family protein [Pelagibacterium xiamenense]MCD7059170.1 transglutaminase family protein [Pelagibacterium xiamenense]
MRISIRHEFRFACPEGTQHAVQHLLLTPTPTKAQAIAEWSIAMPGIDGAAKFVDAFGNTAHLVSQRRPEEDLFIAVTGVVDTHDTSGVVGWIENDPNVALFKRTTVQTRPNGHLVNRLRAQIKGGMGRVDLFHWLMNTLYEARVAQADDDEDEEEPLDIVAEDHAHVFVAALRGIDIPARFVTGYVLKDAGTPARLHAWAEAYDPSLGWIGFDASANLCPTEAYVRLAAGLDAETTAPVRLIPDLSPEGDETVRVSQVMMNQQQ